MSSGSEQPAGKVKLVAQRFMGAVWLQKGGFRHVICRETVRNVLESGGPAVWRDHPTTRLSWIPQASQSHSGLQGTGITATQSGTGLTYSLTQPSFFFMYFDDSMMNYRFSNEVTNMQRTLAASTPLEGHHTGSRECYFLNKDTATTINIRWN